MAELRTPYGLVEIEVVWYVPERVIPAQRMTDRAPYLLVDVLGTMTCAAPAHVGALLSDGGKKTVPALADQIVATQQWLVHPHILTWSGWRESNPHHWVGSPGP